MQYYEHVNEKEKVKDAKPTDAKKVFYYDTIVGRIGIAEKAGAISDIFYANSSPKLIAEEQETFVIEEAFCQLDEYFHKQRKDFKLPILLEGTEFQVKVWRELSKIPYGQTRSYAQVAEAIGSKSAARAVGLANNKNPIAIVIPCHRVIGESGKLVGYGGGLNIKRLLLDIEGCTYIDK